MSEFRRVTLSGIPHQLEITIDGICRDLFTRKILSIHKYKPYKADTDPFNKCIHVYINHKSFIKMRLIYLIASAWWDADLSSITNSVYKDKILEYKEFELITTNDKASLHTRSSKAGRIYWITKYGDVWEGRFHRKLEIRSDVNGYSTVSLPILEGTSKNNTLLLHRLVAKYFVPVPEYLLKLGYITDTLTVNHIDCNKSNNHWNNLEWCIKAENIMHASLNNLMPTNISNELLNKIGEKLVENMLTVREIGELFGINPMTIASIRLRRIPRYCRLWEKYRWPLTDEELTCKSSYVMRHNA